MPTLRRVPEYRQNRIVSYMVWLGDGRRHFSNNNGL